MATTTILIVAAEAFPLAKTGGLGDAITGMARALDEADIAVTVLLPAYRGVRRQLQRVRVAAEFAPMPGGPARLLQGACPRSGISFLLLENDALYDRAGLYADECGAEYPDNGLRYAALAHAAVRIAQGAGGLPRPDLVHAHDWHAALVPLLLRAAGVNGVRSILTIHNLAFQGQFPVEDAAGFGIDAAWCNEDGLVAWGRLNFMKAGIRYADRVTTVSRTYAREILTPAFGCGLDGLLRARGADLLPIPNGIDPVLWNPVRDPHLGDLRFGPRDLGNKALCKAALQKAFGLAVRPDATVLAMGSRLTEQKMADVAAQVLPAALDRHPDLQVAILGQGERRFEQRLRALERAYPGRCGAHIGYDEATAHQLHAGTDLLLHGSRFEPFGLTPLYAMRYGALPIGSRVGGMADTIEDPGPRAPLSAMAGANGFLFDGDSPEAMAGAVDRALALRGQHVLWRAMQRNAMTADFSWRSAVTLYANLYRTLAGSHPAGPKLLPMPAASASLAGGSVLAPRRHAASSRPAAASL
ncbi:glycogen synthase GlgA [Achromobacter sp. Marseille-Q4962]|uniref:glycogen synthase GlgA n=1 Tax=Achromobacter sp. Marseille-Q4962 TaxID=2942202 RepID=UPI002072FE43|nr:glycogen synthase GlgA [Achromobacter sp. Marseille-Q4962]